MSATAAHDPPNLDVTTPKPKKNKKRSKKGKADKNAVNGESRTNNTSTVGEDAEDDGDGAEDDSRPPTEPQTPSSPHIPQEAGSKRLPNGFKPPLEARSESHGTESAGEAGQAKGQPEMQQEVLSTQSEAQEHTDPPVATQSQKLDALTRERQDLRDEVSHLRRSLEELQKKHTTEMQGLREDVSRVQGERDEKGSQYQSLLGKVNTIRSQLGERLKADAEDLAQARAKIEELEEQNTSLHEVNEAREVEIASLAEQGEQQSKELSGLRNRTLLSQQNFGKERDDLLQREKYAKEEFEAAKQAMQEWEILAMEERSIRESMQDKVSQLEEQMAAHREAQERADAMSESQSATVNGLQRALQELQDARRRELRELVENSQSQVDELQKQLQEKEFIASANAGKVQNLQGELDRALPFEKEVKEKNLLIGKLRHEAVILSDHLTKTLRYVKKGKPEDTIDKQIITNHLMRFLELDRADPKKFQVLQIIAGMLAWTDEQREQAGLSRPGASNPNLRVPLSPWHRTPSTPSLNTDAGFDNNSRKESLAELWSEFLEQEAGDALKSPKSPDSAVAGSSSANSKPP